MKYKNLASYVILAASLNYGCKPNNNFKEDISSHSEVKAEKPEKEGEKNLPEISKFPKMPPVKNSDLESRVDTIYINKSGTRFRKTYHRTRPDKLPKIEIIGFYNLLDDELGIRIEKVYEEKGVKEKNEVKMIRKRGSENIEKIIVEHKGESEGVCVVQKTDKEAFFWYDKGLIKLNKISIDSLFRNADSYWEVYFRQLESDVNNAMPVMKQRKAELEGRAKEEYEKAIGLIGY